MTSKRQKEETNEYTDSCRSSKTDVHRKASVHILVVFTSSLFKGNTRVACQNRVTDRYPLANPEVASDLETFNDYIIIEL